MVAAISTLVVSIFYLIPQMVGAGSLIQPLFNFQHWHGVLIVGATVILIVVMAGMVSTTYVQFIKGGLLVLFSLILTGMILNRGFEVADETTNPFRTIGPITEATLQEDLSKIPGLEKATVIPNVGDPKKDDWVDSDFVRTTIPDNGMIVWHKQAVPDSAGKVILYEAQVVESGVNSKGEKTKVINGLPQGKGEGETDLRPIGFVSKLPGGIKKTGPLGPFKFFSTLNDSEVILSRSETLSDGDGKISKVYYQKPTSGREVLRPGEHPRFKGIRSKKPTDKLNFLSLMLALFCGTASLPHILIRYYTVKDGSSARKSTIVGIASIGFFYVLTLFLGLGAMTSGWLDPTDTNMAAPLLAKSMGNWLFAIISAIAFTTVLGTVSGLILASSGAVAHDLVASVFNFQLTDTGQVRLAKIASVVVGVIAIALGIAFKNYNVNFLVGWAFSIAASANLPALIMILFWKKTTSQGVIAAITVGMISSLGWILLSGATFKSLYGLTGDAAVGFVPFDQPGLVTIPLGFVVLVVVSLMTQKRSARASTAS